MTVGYAAALGSVTVLLWTLPTLCLNFLRFRSFEEAIAKLLAIGPGAAGLCGAATLAVLATSVVMTAVGGPGVLLSAAVFATFALGTSVELARAIAEKRNAAECGCLGGVLSVTVTPASVLFPATLAAIQATCWVVVPNGSTRVSGTDYLNATASVIGITIMLISMDVTADMWAKRRNWLSRQTGNEA